ncbi:CRISPR-associated (Cas) DxTHG family protein [Desulfurococcus amylolyticus 1221n]|uniref:CRISPR-associated (Cas) DxTHG family protein n=1 Tax=Desulfurococcus amylolyticus (strain DSM 18924 / JCM 16383 / VKM B-2413 / 1221n) TaxID=490899 RepID=B8D4T7_DESA1|nr:TM1812 family CRISPR-associated protein [Desulfurococcus amylolyticus]ACL11118.1 CRISPR-associated (Cas) DxTHG family protein [Desulfurococcus amylolyticus 1221n]
MRVLIEPWGDPASWSYARYVLHEDSEVKRIEPSFTTLPAHGADYALVYVLDTLSVKSLRHRSQEGGSLAGLLKSQDKPLFESLKNETIEYVKSYLCGDKVPDQNIRVFHGIADFYGGQAPAGAGGPSPEVRFTTDLGSLRLSILYETFTRVVEATRPRGLGEDLEVLLDTSHGVNYFTITVREAVFEAAAMLSMARASQVWLRVYSTGPPPERRVVRRRDDPCKPESSGEPPEMDIYLLYKEAVHPWRLVDYLAYAEVDKVVKQEAKEFEGLAEELNKEWMEKLSPLVKRVVAAFRVAAVPVLVILVKEALGGNGHLLKEMDDFAKKVHSEFHESIHVDEEKGRPVVRPGLRLLDGFRALLHARAIVEGVVAVAGGLNGGARASLEEVEKVKGRLLKGSKIAVELVNREIAKIRDDPTGTIENARRFCDRYDSADAQVLVRDFIAHAGFDYCLLDYDAQSREWAFREEKARKVYRVLDEIAKKLTK